ncbi:MAG: IMP dehydrogenase [Acidobacteriota bacterium]
MELERLFLGKTYDDFLFRPQGGTVKTRREIRLASRLSGSLTLELPVIAANMDSVTGERMARTMALEGGIGFIHRAYSIQEQAHHVERLKRSHGYTVEQPLSLAREATIRQARAFTRQHNITGILIEESRGSNLLAGLLSNRDMPWMDGYEERRVEEFMTPLKRLKTAPPDVTVEQAERIMFENRIEKLPLIDHQNRIRGLITKKDIAFMRHRPAASKDGKGRLLVGAAIGARGDYLERAAELVKAGVDILVIDIAHGHSEVMRAAVESFRKRLGDVQLICGNVGTAEGALFLKDLGADAIKVGIGPGRGCRTRLETGAGVPQLQAIREAERAVGDSVPLIADGGIKGDKDIFMALVCGASSVMLGSMLSGTDEAPGYVIEDPATHEKKKIYRGMTSPQAVFEALYDTENPQQLEEAMETPAEGQEIQVPYRGSVIDILQRIRGHLRSSVSYGGASSLQEIRQLVLENPSKYLIPLSESSIRESYER